VPEDWDGECIEIESSVTLESLIGLPSSMTLVAGIYMGGNLEARQEYEQQAKQRSKIHKDKKSDELALKALWIHYAGKYARKISVDNGDGIEVYVLKPDGTFIGRRAINRKPLFYEKLVISRIDPTYDILFEFINPNHESMLWTEIFQPVVVTHYSGDWSVKDGVLIIRATTVRDDGEAHRNLDKPITLLQSGIESFDTNGYLRLRSGSVLEPVEGD